MGVDTDALQRGLGAVIRLHRQALGLSQEVLAERCRLHRTYIGSVERGERNLALGNVVRLATALGLTPSGMLAEAEALAQREVQDER